MKLVLESMPPPGDYSSCGRSVAGTRPARTGTAPRRLSRLPGLLQRDQGPGRAAGRLGEAFRANRADPSHAEPLGRGRASVRRRTACRARTSAEELWRNIWRELIWPCRRAWIGLAAIWLALLAVNARLSDHPIAWPALGSSSAAEMMQSWEEQTRVLAELTQPAMVYVRTRRPSRRACQSPPSRAASGSRTGKWYDPVFFRHR